MLEISRDKQDKIPPNLPYSDRKKVKTAMVKVNKKVAADVFGECVKQKSKEINKKKEIY